MEKYDRDNIYLTGSKKTVKRTIYFGNGKLWIEWYGQMIEVIETIPGYKTVEKY